MAEVFLFHVYIVKSLQTERLHLRVGCETGSEISHVHSTYVHAPLGKVVVVCCIFRTKCKG